MQRHLKKVLNITKTNTTTNNNPKGIHGGSPSLLDIKSMSVKRKVLRDYLELRYPKSIAGKIIEIFEFNNMVTLIEIVDKFNLLLNASREDRMDFCFQLYDYNEDDLICMKDIMDLMKIINDNDYYL